MRVGENKKEGGREWCVSATERDRDICPHTSGTSFRDAITECIAFQSASLLCAYWCNSSFCCVSFSISLQNGIQWQIINKERVYMIRWASVLRMLGF